MRRQPSITEEHPGLLSAAPTDHHRGELTTSPRPLARRDIADRIEQALLRAADVLRPERVVGHGHEMLGDCAGGVHRLTTRSRSRDD